MNTSLYKLTTRKSTSRKGFTLIELLVVISIISILASIAYTGLNVAKIRARDARRVSDLRTLKVALESYAIDHDGNFPCPVVTGIAGCDTDVVYYESSTGKRGETFFDSMGTYIASACISSGSAWPTNGALRTALDTSYISELPIDPNNSQNSCYVYTINPDHKGVSIYALAEKTHSNGAAYLYGITVGAKFSSQDFLQYPEGFAIGALDITEVITEGGNPIYGSSGNGI